MDQPHVSNWRQMFERGARSPERGDTLGDGHGTTAGNTPPHSLGGYDDGYQPPPNAGGDAPCQFLPQGEHAARDARPLSPHDIAEEAALALAHDTMEYRPWVLQRGARPVLMLHLRRYEPKSALWMGWELSYPHLIAVEYTGDRLLNLDFGTRQFMLEGTGLDELASHLQTGNVVMVQEYAASVWSARLDGPHVSAIRKIGPGSPAQ